MTAGRLIDLPSLLLYYFKKGKRAIPLLMDYLIPDEVDGAPVSIVAQV